MLTTIYSDWGNFPPSTRIKGTCKENPTHTSLKANLDVVGTATESYVKVEVYDSLKINSKRSRA